MPLDRGDLGFAIYVVANAVWAWAAIVDLGGIYAVADILCVVAAALLLAGWHLARPLVLAGGAGLSLACQGPFYVRGFEGGGVSVVAQLLFVASFVVLLYATWAWHRGDDSHVRFAMRVAGALFVLDGAAFLLAEGSTAGLWQVGNLLSGVAGLPLMIVGKPRPRP